MSFKTNNQESTNVFVPMSESKMASTKGGTDWDQEAVQDFILDWIEQQAEDPESFVAQFLAMFNPPATVDEDYWDQIGNELSEEGFMLPPWEALDPAVHFHGSM